MIKTHILFPLISAHTSLIIINIEYITSLHILKKINDQLSASSTE